MRRTAAIWTGLSLALGCAAGPAPTDHFYRLEAAEPARELAKPRLPGSVRVNRLRSETMTDGTSLLVRDDENPAEVVRLAYHHWTDAPTLMLRDQMVRYLQRAGVAGRVLTPSVRGAVDYTLSGRILQLERRVGSGGERVDIEVEFSLLRESDRVLVLHRSYAEVEKVTGSGVAAAVEAWNRALTRLFGRFVADIENEARIDLAARDPWPR